MIEVLTKNFLNKDGTLKIMEWAKEVELFGNEQHLSIDLGPRPQGIAHSCATGQSLVSNGKIGVDLIQLEAGNGFIPHMHPGDHVLIVVGGKGTITFDGKVYPTQAGQVYIVEGKVPHAVGAITDHVILAVGSPHKPVDSPERMTPVEYQAVVAKLGDLHCLICNVKAFYPTMLHQVGCSHCPCEECNS